MIFGLLIDFLLLHNLVLIFGSIIFLGSSLSLKFSKENSIDSLISFLLFFKQLIGSVSKLINSKSSSSSLRKSIITLCVFVVDGFVSSFVFESLWKVSLR